MYVFISYILLLLMAVKCDYNAKNKDILGLNNVTSEEDAKVNDVALAFVQLLGDDNNERIKDLKEKLKKIDRYIIDRDKYTEFLINETKSTDLNHTNFYNALNESDHFQFLIMDVEPKNLYIRLKEKMNRDDIMNILANRSKNNDLASSARKMMANDLIGERSNKYSAIDIVVDKVIAESPIDKHTFDYHKGNDSYWDPQGELEDLKEFHEHNARRIFKGERTTVKFYPFMVSVHVMGRFWCGGVIYKSDLVLTSAACLQLLHNNRFFRENPVALTVRIGSNHSRIGGEIVEALEVYFHPGYNSRNLRHNIAIIRLRRHIFFDHHRVPKLIHISHNDAGIPPTSEVLILGWGVTKMTQRLTYEPIFLNRKVLPVYPNVFCKEVYGKKFITSTMFCAGTLTTGEGACDHDAGGPAVIAGKLVGIISFGPSVCGYPNTPTVFTLVGAYADWIETIDENMPRYYQGRKRTTTHANNLKFGDAFLKTTTKRPRTATIDTYIPTLVIDEPATPVPTTTTTTTTTPNTTTTEAPFPAVRYGQKSKDASNGWSIEMIA